MAVTPTPLPISPSWMQVHSSHGSLYLRPAAPVAVEEGAAELVSTALAAMAGMRVRGQMPARRSRHPPGEQRSDNRSGGRVRI